METLMGFIMIVVIALWALGVPIALIVIASNVSNIRKQIEDRIQSESLDHEIKDTVGAIFDKTKEK